MAEMWRLFGGILADFWRNFPCKRDIILTSKKTERTLSKIRVLFCMEKGEKEADENA